MAVALAIAFAALTFAVVNRAWRRAAPPLPLPLPTPSSSVEVKLVPSSPAPAPASGQ